MKLGTIIDAHQVLDSMSDKQGLSPRLAYNMTKFVLKTQTDANSYAAGAKSLVDKLGVMSDDGKLGIPLEKMDEFNAALAELRDTEVEDPGIRFPLSQLDAELKLSMQQIYKLMDFIEEEK